MGLLKWIKSLFNDDYQSSKIDKALKKYKQDLKNTSEVTQDKWCPECFSPKVMKSLRWINNGVLEKESMMCLECHHNYVYKHLKK